MKTNEILLRRRNKVMINSKIMSGEQKLLPYVVTMMKNIENLGYTFSKQLFDALAVIDDQNEMFQFYLELVRDLQKMVGANVVYKPMYPNFPKSVMEKDEAELYLNAIIHYWSEGTLFPYEKKEMRLPLFDVTKVKTIELGTVEDIQDIFYNLCLSKTSLSQTDIEDLTLIFKEYNLEFPEEIPLKENVAVIGKLYLENYPNASAKEIQKYFKTATDVLRLITAMSNGDISLASNTKFRNFKRRERRIFMELLQNCGSIEEDMLRNKGRWIRVGEKIHPGEYDKKRFSKVITAFNKLRNGIKISTFKGRFNSLMENKDYEKALSLLKNRPGEFARSLDYLLRTVDNKRSVINTFHMIAAEVSTPVLLQVREFYLHRNEGMEQRVFFPKGQLAKSWYRTNDLPEVEEQYSKMLVNICENALIENYRKKDFLGNVYLSEDLKSYIVPFSQRSASKTLKTYVRGSRIPINENTKILRGFIWWTNIDNEARTWSDSIDLDLSATFYDENWGYKTHVSYTWLRDTQYGACHSGDIVDGGPVDGEGVSEFLDVDIEKAIENGVRYVVYQVYNFSQRPFSELPHAMFGWMGRQEPNSGEIYEPKTVEQKMDLTAGAENCVPVIFDLVTREVIWCDMDLRVGGRGICANNLEQNFNRVTATCYSMVNMKKPNLYDLFDLHIKARGIRIDNKEDADIIFDVEDGITPFHTETIMGEYL